MGPEKYCKLDSVNIFIDHSTLPGVVKLLLYPGLMKLTVLPSISKAKTQLRFGLTDQSSAVDAVPRDSEVNSAALSKAKTHFEIELSFGLTGCSGWTKTDSLRACS